MNIPYVKKYKNGILTNPIEGKYENKFPNRRERNPKTQREFNNKKGIQLVVTRIGKYKFSKYRKVIQRIGKKAIVHYQEA